MSWTQNQSLERCLHLPFKISYYAFVLSCQQPHFSQGNCSAGLVQEFSHPGLLLSAFCSEQPLVLENDSLALDVSYLPFLSCVNTCDWGLCFVGEEVFRGHAEWAVVC